MEAEEKKEYSPQAVVEAIVDLLDAYFFRLQTPDLVITGNAWGVGPRERLAAPDASPAARKHDARYHGLWDDLYALLPKGPGRQLLMRLDEIVGYRLLDRQDFWMLFGLVFGLRLSGMPTDQVVKMAAVWGQLPGHPFGEDEGLEEAASTEG